jgi:tetratricopeptide (TPR) repeat protein
MSDATYELLQQGIAAAKAGQDEQARKALLKVLEVDERNEQAWLWLSGVVEPLEEKRICLENVLAINPDSSHAQIGLRWLERNAPAQVTVSIDQETCPHCGAQVPASGTTCPHCQQPLLVACPACGQYVDVQNPVCPDCGQALGDFHTGAPYYLELAQAYLGQNRHELAQEALAYATATALEDAQTLGQIAGLYEKTGYTDQAIAAYRKAIEKEPGAVTFYTALAAIYRQHAQLDEARALLEKAERMAGGDPAVLLGLARLSLEQEGPTRGVIESLRKVTRKQPTNAEAFLVLGDVYLAQHQYKQARQHYEQAAELAPPDSAISREARHKRAQTQVPTYDAVRAERETEDRPILAVAQQRPGCVTLFALLTALGALVGLLGALGLAAVVVLNRDMITGLLTINPGNTGPFAINTAQLTGTFGIYVAVALVLSGFGLAVARGLWKMNNWARITVLILQVLGLLGTLLLGGFSILTLRPDLTSFELNTISASLLGAFVAGLAIQAYIVFWFAANGKRFG